VRSHLSENLGHHEALSPEPSHAPARPAEGFPKPPQPARGLRILYVGPKDGTCLQRAESLRALGADVFHLRAGNPTIADPMYQLLRVSHKIKRHPDIYLGNSRLLRDARRSSYDVVWIDKGLWIRPRTLRRMRDLLPGARFVAYSPDDMCNPGNQSKRYFDSLPRYDFHVTTKSYNVAELSKLGAREMFYIDNSYDRSVHRPLELSDEERASYGAEVGFVGAFEEERAEMLYGLAEAGIPVSIRGPEWSRFFDKTHPNLRVVSEWVDDEAYPRVVNATRINLGFLRKANRDLQTTRSIEIPACRGFMLAERTEEHQRLFREGIEAEFFEGFDELLAKCRQYLVQEDERRRVAENGHRRCIFGGYSNEGRLLSVLEHAMEITPQVVHEGASVTRLPFAPGRLEVQSA